MKEQRIVEGVKKYTVQDLKDMKVKQLKKLKVKDLISINKELVVASSTTEKVKEIV